jgi:hypothetical protein
MNIKKTKTFIKHYNVCFKAIKRLENGFEIVLMTFFAKFLT